MLTFVVEHVLLLTVEILDGEAVLGEIAVSRHPLLNRRERNLEQFRIEPGALPDSPWRTGFAPADALR